MSKVLAMQLHQDVLEDSEYLFVVSLRANGGDLAEFLDRLLSKWCQERFELSVDDRRSFLSGHVSRALKERTL